MLKSNTSRKIKISGRLWHSAIRNFSALTVSIEMHNVRQILAKSVAVSLPELTNAKVLWFRRQQARRASRIRCSSIITKLHRHVIQCWRTTYCLLSQLSTEDKKVKRYLKKTVHQNNLYYTRRIAPLRKLLLFWTGLRNL